MERTVQQLRQWLDKGLVPAVPVFFNSEGEYQSAAQDSYVQYLAGQDVAGVAVWAHTGRGLKLEQQLANRVIESWRSALPGKVLIAGAGSGGRDINNATKESVLMAERAAKYGADALLVYPPTWLKGQPRLDALIVAHHQQLASATNLPLILFYLYDAAGGINYSGAVLDELLAMPEVCGIKMATLDSVMTYQDVSRRIADRHPEQLLLTGEDRFLGYSLRRGAQAALIGMGAVCTGLQIELLRAHFCGDAARFLELSDLVDQLAEATFVAPMEGYIGRLLLVLGQQGIIPQEAAHDPWGPELDLGDDEKIGRVLAELQTARG